MLCSVYMYEYVCTCVYVFKYECAHRGNLIVQEEPNLNLKMAMEALNSAS